MFQSIVNSVEALVTQFTWQRFFVFLFVIACLLAAVAIFEYYTGYFRIARIEKEMTLLASARKLAEAPSSDREIAQAESRLKEKIVGLVNQGSITSPFTPEVTRFFAALAPWLLFALVFLPGLPKGDEKHVGGLLGVLLFGVIFGFLGLLLPATWPAGVLYFGYPAVHFIIVIGLVFAYSKRKERAS